MSVVLRTIQAFPRGRTIEELQVLLGNAFHHDQRLAVLAELEHLSATGAIRRRSDGRWIPVAPATLSVARNPRSHEDGVAAAGSTLVAAPFSRSVRDVVDTEILSDAEAGGQLDPQSLLRYWRSALRADPRGATTEAPDRHGSAWHLVAGRGPILPEKGQTTLLTIDLDALSSDFRAALLRREANENALAIGWPIAIGRRSGVPAIWPIGLIAAEWQRADGRLLIEIPADDVLVNPDWLKGAARMTGWRARDLAEVFAHNDGIGFSGEEFLSRLRDAAAGQMRMKVTGDWTTVELNPDGQGIFDAAALFLPDDSSFTAGAVRDLDQIATWSPDRLATTALAPVLSLPSQVADAEFPAINVGPLNAEQIAAVRSACRARLTVVTGPPGTGKSQAIVSMAASVLMAGGSVLVASKNHQALDAVEDRIGALAPEAPFLVRTLDPARDIDVSFSAVLTEIISGQHQAGRPFDEVLHARLSQLAADRAASLDVMSRRAELECEIAELIERLESRGKHLQSDGNAGATEDVQEGVSGLRKLLAWLRSFFWSRDSAGTLNASGGTDLERELALRRADRDRLEASSDVIALSNTIAELSKTLLPVALKARTSISSEARESLDHAKADLDFHGAKGPLPGDLAQAVVRHRPLWLASVLGTPKRIPLTEDLFDLVIFDEASQCDIASALPLLARARRAVVVGDNRQLSFIAQLGQAQDRNLMQAQGLPVARMSRYAQSRNSLFDFARRVPGCERIMLRQQYRSAGPIVDYISREFYGQALRTAYDPKTINPPKGRKPGIDWTHVPAPMAMEANNVNPAEVAAIVSHLESLLLREGYEGTVGVTSPFRGQVHAIEQAVRARLPSHKLEAAEFRVATVDGFQGQERDVMLFSPTLGASSRMSAVTFVQKDHRRLNVAISRARAVAHVFGDLDYARSSKVRTLAALAAAATEPRKRSGEGIFDSDWERKVYHALVGRGLAPKPQFEIAGRRLDFALFGAGDIKLDLEVDGRLFHEGTDGGRKLSDHWRDHQLKSLGWRVRRFWVDELAKDMEACLDLIERDLA